MPRICVIGAGPSGMSVLHWLEEKRISGQVQKKTEFFRSNTLKDLFRDPDPRIRNLESGGLLSAPNPDPIETTSQNYQ